MSRLLSTKAADLTCHLCCIPEKVRGKQVPVAPKGADSGGSKFYEFG